MAQTTHPTNQPLGGGWVGPLLHQQSRMAKQTAYGTTGEEDLEFVEPKAVARDALQVISGLVLARGLGQSQDRNFELTA